MNEIDLRDPWPSRAGELLDADQHHFLLAGTYMGVTIHYHGTIDDLTLVEEMEDRVVDRYNRNLQFGEHE